MMKTTDLKDRKVIFQIQILDARLFQHKMTKETLSMTHLQKRQGIL